MRITSASNVLHLCRHSLGISRVGVEVDVLVIIISYERDAETAKK